MAQNLRKMGVIIMAIGVGQRISHTELRLMASTPASHHVFTVSNPNLLSTLEKKVETELCKGMFIEKK